MHLEFELLSWGAWSPDFQTPESWLQWQQPNSNPSPKSDSPALKHIPAMQRRRFSRLTKMMLTAAYQCQPQNNCRSIFSSRHGELTRTLGLLKDITQKQALSPMAFSQSVHNTASGIFGIVNNNTASSTSIAAGEQTLTQALIEAYAQLAQSPQPVLVVFGDDPVPPVYSEFTHEIELPLALGLYLAPFNSCAQQAKKQLADIVLQPASAQRITLSVSDHPLDNHNQNNISLSELIHHIANKKISKVNCAIGIGHSNIMTNQQHTAQAADTIEQKKASAPKLSGLRYIPRWIGGVCCYIAFGLGGLLSSLTILPLLRFWPGEKTVRVARSQKAVSWMFKAFVAMLSFAGVIAVSTKNIEALQQTKGKVVIANHPTLVDVVVLISLMPNAGCIVKQSLWRNPFIRGVLASAGYIPNRGADWLLHDCQQVLRTDTNLIIFPEGTRTLTGNIVNSFARGAANIALRTKTDILPVVLRTDVAGLTKQQSWYQIPRQTINMSVEIGTSMSYLLYDAKQGNEAKMARQLTRDLQQFYLDTLKQPIKSH